MVHGAPLGLVISLCAISLALAGCGPREIAFGAPCANDCATGYTCVDNVCLPSAALAGEGEGEGEGEGGNRPPTLFGATVVMLLPDRAARTVPGQVTATDPDPGDVLSYTVVAVPEGVELALDAATGAFQLTSSAPLAEELTAIVEVSDGSATDQAEIAIFIVDFAADADVRAVWTGAVSDSVDDGENWEPANVPAPTTEVFIPQGAPHMPVLGNDVTWMALFVENGAFIEAGTRSVIVAGDNERPCFIGGEVRSSSIQEGLRVSAVRLAGSLPAVTATSTVSIVAPTTASALIANSQGSGFSVGAPLHVLGDLIVAGNTPVVATDARIVVEGNADLNVQNGMTFSGGELRVRSDLFIRRNSVGFVDGNRLVVDGAGPQQVAAASTVVDMVVSGEAVLVETAGINPRFSVFNKLSIESSGSVLVPEGMTLTLLPDATLELSPGAKLSGALVEIGGPVSAVDSIYEVALTRLTSTQALPWPTELRPLDVEVERNTAVQLGAPAALDGALLINGRLDVGEQQLEAASLVVDRNGQLIMQDPLAVVTASGAMSLQGPSPDVVLAAGLVRVGGDLALGCPFNVNSYGGPGFAFELNGPGTLSLSPDLQCNVDTGTNCRVPRMTIAVAGEVAFPALLFVTDTLRVDGKLLLTGGAALVVGDLEIGEEAEIVLGDCPAVALLPNPATAAERAPCNIYIVDGGSCLDDTGLYGCP